MAPLVIYFSGGPWNESVVAVSPWEPLRRREMQVHRRVTNGRLFQGQYERVGNVALWMGWVIVPDG